MVLLDTRLMVLLDQPGGRSARLMEEKTRRASASYDILGRSSRQAKYPFVLAAHCSQVLACIVLVCFLRVPPDGQLLTGTLHASD